MNKEMIESRANEACIVIGVSEQVTFFYLKQKETTRVRRTILERPWHSMFFKMTMKTLCKEATHISQQRSVRNRCKHWNGIVVRGGEFSVCQGRVSDDTHCSKELGEHDCDKCDRERSAELEAKGHMGHQDEAEDATGNVKVVVEHGY